MPFRYFRDSDPPHPIELRIPSDPPAAPVAVSFDEEGDIVPALPVLDPQDARTDPDRSRGPQRASPSERLTAWAIDGALVLAASALHVWAAGRVLGPTRYWLDLLRNEAALWLAVTAVLAVAYSAVCTALAARTPGMALTGQRLQTLRGKAPSPAAAVVRAALAIPSAVLGLFGFTLALFDARGQTLHDKLCGCVVIVD